MVILYYKFLIKVHISGLKRNLTFFIAKSIKTTNNAVLAYWKDITDLAETNFFRRTSR